MFLCLFYPFFYQMIDLMIDKDFLYYTSIPFCLVHCFHYLCRKDIQSKSIVMPTINSLFYRLTFLFLLLLLSACGSKREVILPPDFKGPQELSKLYGVRLTPNDNIYLYNAGAHWLGVPHRMGGMSKQGVDCSGFVLILFRNVYGINLSRSAADMLKRDCRKISRSKLQEGDLVFFQTGRGSKNKPNHVGIYLKNNRFIHVSTSRGVMVSRLDEPYYMRTWVTGGRVK